MLERPPAAVTTRERGRWRGGGRGGRRGREEEGDFVDIDASLVRLGTISFFSLFFGIFFRTLTRVSYA